MVVDHHERTGGKARVDAAGRIGQDHAWHAERADHSHGERDVIERVPFIDVRAARESDYPLGAQQPGDEHASMPHHRRRGPMRNLGVRHTTGIGQAIGEGAEAGAEHDRDVGLGHAAGPEEQGGGAHTFQLSKDRHDSSVSAS